MDEETEPPEQSELSERSEKPEQPEEAERPERPAAGSAVCARCGTIAEGDTVPLTWLSSMEDGRRLHFCENCARLHIRAIESRLDSLWW
ncbi:hypothetical protein [Streptomyces pakalii]|uniref:Small CPxCG-related zinc finger protein n=1 Tax=Streptomyces pakalii TaxID=3036494 RepID=A0ABT7CZB0_9ACTN|nr:hypothetical protein [Streptomyces pakalii]MDJ1638879.1 hypothetical protein [Streptomyces pakalii]